MLGGIFVFISIFFFGIKDAKALHFTTSACQYTIAAGKASFAPGETMTIKMIVTCEDDFNELMGQKLFANITASSTTLDKNDFLTGHALPASTYTLFDSSVFGGIRTTSKSITVSAPSSPGSYKVILTTKSVGLICGFSGWRGNCFDGGCISQCIVFNDLPFAVTTPPPTCNAFWSPSGPIAAGGSSTIYWSSTNATSATYTCSGPIPGSGSVGTSGNLPVTFPSAGTEKCTISVSGPGGSSMCSGSLVINPPASPPTCSAYWSPSGPITVGGASTAYWTSSANATSATYSCTGPISGSGSVGTTGSSPFTFPSAGTEKCTLNVSGPGGSGSCIASLVVNDPICTVTSWSPDPFTVCSGTPFTQTSNCGTQRGWTGTKVCGCTPSSFTYSCSDTACGSCGTTQTTAYWLCIKTDNCGNASTVLQEECTVNTCSDTTCPACPTTSDSPNWREIEP